MRFGPQFPSRVLATFVHRDVRGGDIAEHVGVLQTLLLQGTAAACVLPFAATGPGWVTTLAAAWFVVPVALAALVSGTGRLAVARLVSLSLLALTLAFVSATWGGLGPLGLAWVAILPLEAALVGRHRTILAALATSGLLIAGLTGLLLWPNGPLEIVVAAGPQAYVVMIAVALAYALSLAWRLERRRGSAQSRIAAQENRFRLIAEHSGDLITSHAPDGATTYASPAARALLGCEPEDLQGSGLFERVHVQDRVSFRHAVAKSADEGLSAECRFRIAREGAGYVWMEMRCRPVTDDAGDVGEVVMVTRDVSLAVDRERDLADAHAEAERISSAKSHFLAVVSHELRTPLNAILGFSDLLRLMGPTLPQAKHREYVDLINQSGTHLLGVVNDLLDASRLEAGRYELCPTTVDCGEIVRGCASMMLPVANEAGVEIETAAPPAPLEADERAVRQIVTNLLGNAVKFSAAGSSVSIEVAKAPTGVTIAVADTGPGMTARDMERIGQPFTQFCDGHDRRHEGAGLGLSIVKGLVALHGGTVRFDSRPGQGTRVAVTLPPKPPVSREAIRVVSLNEHAATRTASTTDNEAPRSNEYGRVSA